MLLPKLDDSGIARESSRRKSGRYVGSRWEYEARRPDGDLPYLIIGGLESDRWRTSRELVASAKIAKAGHDRPLWHQTLEKGADGVW
jgi:hypothetical protein